MEIWISQVEAAKGQRGSGGMPGGLAQLMSMGFEEVRSRWEAAWVLWCKVAHEKLLGRLHGRLHAKAAHGKLHEKLIGSCMEATWEMLEQLHGSWKLIRLQRSWPVGLISAPSRIGCLPGP